MSTQVVLITGALTGIGRAAAVAFAREGHRIAVAGRHEEAGQELVTELRALGTDVEVSASGCAPRGRRALWSIGPSRASVAWTPLSTTPAPKASQAL
jgi:NAD(P)-dependent dehydrogenase (short-subunit alcohol dehydrogenase family)